MSDRELSALTTLGFDELARAAGGIGSIQRAVSGRVFRMVGPGAMLVRPVHEGITRGVYRGLGMGTRAVGVAAGRAAARREGLPLSSTPYGSAVIAAIAGLRGDALEEEGSPLAQPMAVRVAGEPVALEPEAIASAFPAATAAHRRLRPRADDDRVLVGARRSRAVRRPPRARDRLHAGLRPLQQRPPHLGERPLAERADGAAPGRLARGRRSDRARGAFHGRPGGAQRLLSRGGGRRGVGATHQAQRLARHAAHGRAARAGGAHAQRRARAAAGDAPVRELPAAPQRRHPRPAPRARSSTRTGATATRTRCAEPPAPRFRCSRARLTASCRPRSPAATAIPSAG